MSVVAGGPNMLDRADAVYVPDLFVAEVTNAIWKQHHFGGVELKACESALERILELPDIVVPSEILSRAAFQLARSSGHSVYDMFYIALARREAATLFTKDKAMRKLAQRYDIDIA